MKKIYLVDVSSLFFRAYFAVRPLTSPAGVPVNAIYGFLSMLLKLMKEHQPEAMVFCYDRKDPSFRKDLYPEYKANRSEMPEDLVPQIPYIKKIADLMGIPSIEVPKYEADDIIGSLTVLAHKNNYEVDIVSGDKDFAQLIKPNIYLLDTMNNVRIGTKEVKDKWGIEASQMIDYLALIGDSSDNVPGVKGIGPKGAVKLLDQYKTLEAIYEHVAEIKGSTQDKLRNNKEMAFLSQKLVTIVTDIPIENEMQNYHLRAPDQAGMRDLLKELNFKGFEKSLNDLRDWSSVNSFTGATAESVKQAETKTSTQENHSKLEKQNKLENDSLPSINSTDSFSNKMNQTGLDFTVEKIVVQTVNGDNLKTILSGLNTDEAYYLFQHTQGLCIGLKSNRTVYLLEDDFSSLQKILDSYSLKQKGFNLKPLWHSLGLKKPEAAWDGTVAAYVLRAGESVDWVQVFSRTLQRAPLEMPSPAEYFAELLELEAKQNFDLQDYMSVYLKQDLPLLAVLYRMEAKGIRLAAEQLQSLSQELGQEIQSIDKKIQELAGEKFNIASPKQLSQILFDKLKLTPGKKTKTGFSTDAEVLEGLKSEHPIIDLILQFRELSKLKSTYVDALPQLIKSDGRLHTTFDQTLTATGRLSSADPNLQNIPIRTARGAQVRKAFIADQGSSLLSVDYSQIELRILAHYSDDQNLIRAFKEGLDIHSATASEVFAVKISDVSSEQRRAAKAINFGIAYGQGAFGLSSQLGISMSEAKEIIENYFHKFPGVQRYIASTVEEAKQKGFVQTLEGRRRYMVELQSKNPAIRKFGERAAINAPIQGTAADLMKLAMVELDQKISSPMILQVHDELIFEAPENILQEQAPEIARIMENIVTLKVPLKANWSIGNNWDAAHA